MIDSGRYQDHYQSFADPPKEYPRSLLTAEELAKTLPGLTANRLVELADSGFIPHVRIENGPPLFRKVEARAWCHENLLNWNRGRTYLSELRVVVYPPPIPDVLELPSSILHIGHRLHLQPGLQHFGPGVYFLCLGADVIYVGQSTAPATRIGQHAEARLFDRAYILPVPVSELDDVEGTFIQLLKPKAQGRHNSGTITSPRVSPAIMQRVLERYSQPSAPGIPSDPGEQLPT